MRMVAILQSRLPDDMLEARALPGIQPLTGETWLRVDEAYAAQMAERRRLIDASRAQVYWQDEMALAAAHDVLAEALTQLPALGFKVGGQIVTCPDGTMVDTTADAPLLSLGRIVQEDICILEKRGNEHVLVAAILCFPAFWMLSEKAGRPLSAIHNTVPEYDANITRRVQRMFDGVQVGRPLWRYNHLRRDDPDLFQPRSVTAPRISDAGEGGAYLRAERQCIFRLAQSGAVVFTIHTYVVAGT